MQGIEAMLHAQDSAPGYVPRRILEFFHVFEQLVSVIVEGGSCARPSEEKLGLAKPVQQFFEANRKVTESARAHRS